MNFPHRSLHFLGEHRVACPYAVCRHKTVAGHLGVVDFTCHRHRRYKRLFEIRLLVGRFGKAGRPLMRTFAFCSLFATLMDIALRIVMLECCVCEDSTSDSSSCGVVCAVAAFAGFDFVAVLV